MINSRTLNVKSGAIARTVAVVAIIVIIVIVAVAGVYLASSQSTTNTGETTSSTSSSTSSSVVASSSPSTSVSSISSASVSSSSSSSVGSSVSTTASSTTAGSSTSTSGSAFRQTLTIDDLFWPGGSDLNQLTAIGEIPYPNWLTYTVYQSLVTVNGSALYSQGAVQPLPMLAQNWTVSPDGRNFTFNLRQVNFSNGDPFNAYQIWGQMYGFYYLAFNASSWMLSYNVFDMSPVNFGPATIALMNQSGLINPNSQLLAIMQNQSWPIYVTGPHTIVFHLKTPFAYFVNLFPAYTGLLFDTQWLLQHGGFGTPTQINTFFNQNPIPGTGPYIVTKVSELSYVQFQQNPTYWGNSLTAAQIQANPYLDPGHAKNVIVNFKPDDLTRYADLSSNTAQVSAVLAQNWPLILANPNTYSYFQMPDKSMLFVGIDMNTHRYPTNITAVRQAIVHAINFTSISDKVFFGGLNPMVGPEYPAQSQYYDLGNLPPYQYNITEAQNILKTAGIDPSKFPALEFRVVSGCSYCESTAEIVQSDLAQIGISVNIIVTLPTQYALPLIAGTGSYASGVNASQSVAQLSWFGTGTFAPAAPTPADAWLLFVNNQTSSNNWAIYSNPTVQACVNGWTNGSDNATLTSLCTKAQAQVYNDAPYYFLGTLKLVFGAGSIAWNKNIVKSMLLDPVYTGQSSTAIFNTIQFVTSG